MYLIYEKYPVMPDATWMLDLNKDIPGHVTWYTVWLLTGESRAWANYVTPAHAHVQVVRHQTNWRLFAGDSWRQ